MYRNDHLPFQNNEELKERLRRQFLARNLGNFLGFIQMIPADHQFTISAAEERQLIPLLEKDKQFRKAKRFDRWFPFAKTIRGFGGGPHPPTLEIASQFCKCGSRIVVRRNGNCYTVQPLKVFERAGSACTCESLLDLKLEYSAFHSFPAGEKVRVQSNGFEIRYYVWED